MDINLIDLHTGGHHRSYLEMVASFWSRRVSEGCLRVFVTREFLDTHNDFPDGLGERVQVHVLDVGRIDNGALSRREMIRLDRAHGRALAIVTRSFEGPAVLMYFDHAQLAVARYRGQRGSISGLYFRSPFDTTVDSPVSTIRRMRKTLILRLAVRNRGVSRIFCLDPRDTREIDSMAGRSVAVALPDGVSVGPPSLTRDQQRLRLGATGDTRLFLLFGVICERKGIVELAAAVRNLEEDVRRQIVLVVAGRVREEEREVVARALTSLAEMVRVVRIDGYVSDGDMESLFAASDVVLVPYTKQHVGSSGILIRAAAWGRPVIGPDSGLMATHIDINQLGQSVATQAGAGPLADALRRAVTDPAVGFEASAAAAFGDANTSDRYAEVLLTELGCTVV